MHSFVMAFLQETNVVSNCTVFFAGDFEELFHTIFLVI